MCMGGDGHAAPLPAVRREDDSGDGKTPLWEEGGVLDLLSRKDKERRGERGAVQTPGEECSCPEPRLPAAFFAFPPARRCPSRAAKHARQVREPRPRPSPAR